MKMIKRLISVFLAAALLMLSAVTGEAAVNKTADYALKALSADTSQAAEYLEKFVSFDENADKFIELLSIKTPSPETPVAQLSGGNQQKVILARWLATNADFLILDEPTRGIDVGTKAEIQKLTLQLAQEGKSVVFISSEIEEMLRTCTRMAVLRDGEKVGEITENLTAATIMKSIAGGAENAEN